MSRAAQGRSERMTPLPHQVQHVLDESRLLIVGAQVLLGFQYRAAFEPGFEGLSRAAQYLNLGALGLMLMAVALLIAPAAYHRRVEAGEDTEDFHRLDGHLLVAAMVPLALGLCGDVLVVAHKVTGSVPLAAGGAAAMPALCAGLWFGVPLARRRSSRHIRPWRCSPK
jgi:hypothetical protein